MRSGVREQFAQSRAYRKEKRRWYEMDAAGWLLRRSPVWWVLNVVVGTLGGFIVWLLDRAPTDAAGGQRSG